MKNNKGFTLLEVLIVVSILAILMAIAIPNYSRYIVRAQRVEARNALQAIAQKIDQQYRITRDYRKLANGDNLDDNTIEKWSFKDIPNANDKRYEIGFVPNSITASGYILQAKAVGRQGQRDSSCAYFFYNQSGSQMASKTAIPPSSRDQSSIECWSK